MPTRKQTKLKLKKGPIIMALSALWLGYRALTSPADLARMTRFVPETTQPAKSAKAPSLIEQAGVLQKKINEEHAVLEDLGNPDGLSRLPAGYTPTVPFSALKAQCPALKHLPPDTSIEIDETGQVLAPAMALKDCQFEPYRGPNGRPLPVRSLYTVAK